jgi:sensor histidine kinase YesM
MESIAAAPRLQASPGTLPAASHRPFAPGLPTKVSALAVIAMAAAARALITASECHSILYWPSLLFGFTLWGWWGLLGGILWKLGPRISGSLRLAPFPLATHIALGSLLGVAHLVLLGSLAFVVPEWHGHQSARAILTSMVQINRFGLEVLIYGFIVGAVSVVQFQMRAQRDAMTAIELQRQLSRAHLRALQMQLEPHFLFNTLNAITTLVELGRRQEAAAMLSHLNTILKSTLKRSTPEKVPLSQELEIVENYLAIEQVRFADRLRVDWKIDPGALDSLVPCFLLQPIVENAIRHGIAHCEEEGRVEASVRREGGLLHLSVRDSGPGAVAQADAGHGIGLSNTRERLAHFYRDAYQMRAQTAAAGGFEVSITIPYERGV